MLNTINTQAVMLLSMKNFGERLQEALDDNKKNASWLANRIGVSRASVSGWLKSPVCKLISENLLSAARALQVRQEWLQNGELPKRVGDDEQLLDHNLEFAGELPVSTKLPIVGTAQLGENGFYEQISSANGFGDGFIAHSTKDPDAYCLRVKGDSMAPAIRNGWYVVVEPGGQINNGEFVLIQLKDGRKMVKEMLFQRGDSIDLMSVNGEKRLSFGMDAVARLSPIAAILPPSKRLEF